MIKHSKTTEETINDMIEKMDALLEKMDTMMTMMDETKMPENGEPEMAM